MSNNDSIFSIGKDRRFFSRLGVTRSHLDNEVNYLVNKGRLDARSDFEQKCLVLDKMTAKDIDNELHYNFQPMCAIVEIGEDLKVCGYSNLSLEATKAWLDQNTATDEVEHAVTVVEDQFLSLGVPLLLEIFFKRESDGVIGMYHDLWDMDGLRQQFEKGINKAFAGTGCKTFDELNKYLLAVESAKQIARQKQARLSEESDFEAKVIAFLEARGVNAFRQLSTVKHRLDIYVPGHMVIELKSGKVTGDDVCQAVDYLASYKMDILLVGTGLSDAATRGVEAVNQISREHQILFVTRNACFRYLEAVVCKLN
jgi:hypothetical protein